LAKNELGSLVAHASALDLMLDNVMGDQRPAIAVTSFEDILERNGVQFDGYASLDTRSNVVSMAVGLVGGVLDLTKTYQKGLYNEDLHQKFDAISKDYIKQITGQSGIAAIDNHRGGAFHRLIGPAHDLSRFFEAVGQIMNGQFESNFGDIFKAAKSYRDGCSEYLAINDPVEATVVLLLHLIGDFFSSQSLPIPGRTSLAEVHDVEVYKAVITEFKAGGNLRGLVSSFLSTMSGTVLIAIVARLYRYYMIFAVERSPMSLKALSLKDDLVFHVMQRNAQTVSFVVSVAKASFSGNPMDINYTGFIQIMRSGASVNRISSEEHRLLESRLQATIKEIEAT